jgi:hypothetical protein
MTLADVAALVAWGDAHAPLRMKPPQILHNPDGEDGAEAEWTQWVGEDAVRSGKLGSALLEIADRVQRGVLAVTGRLALNGDSPLSLNERKLSEQAAITVDSRRHRVFIPQEWAHAEGGWLVLATQTNLGRGIASQWFAELTFDEKVVAALWPDPASAAGKVQLTSRDEGVLVRFLVSIMQNAPEEPIAKSELQKAAKNGGQRIWSGRRFERAYQTAVKLAQSPKWSAPGRRKKSPQS